MKYLVLAALSLGACKGNADREPIPVAAADRKEWSVRDTTSSSGKRLIFNVRSMLPSGITRSEFGWRVVVRCPYVDADGTGLPTSKELDQRQDLEERLESPAAILVVSKTGEGAREANFQVKDATEFRSVVPGVAKEFGLECSSQAVEDNEWSFWKSTVAGFQRLVPVSQ